ncbi:MAG: carbamoyl phosphate synthase small subunit [Planctomycetes bacterium]|nr:carbamoyl phosphate synthase small subunit [Planctomycetota bacterium]
MDGYILLSDGMRLDGALEGAAETAIGWIIANTAVVGFQEMVTDPAYKSAILTFTYPEIGSVGLTEAFSESERAQPAGVVVRVLSEFHSHYQAEGDFGEMLRRAAVPCLSGVDTRGLAVHLRECGEMMAAIAPSHVSPEELQERLKEAGRPGFEPPSEHPAENGAEGLSVAVLNLGMRRSQLGRLKERCAPIVFHPDATAEDILASGAAALYVSDGPCMSVPPAQVVETTSALLGKVPVMGCGLGHVALGLALGCRSVFLRRGHHGANYPVRNVKTGAVAVTHQRHSVALDRKSVEQADGVELLWENINDGSVEGIRAAEVSAIGLQPIWSGPYCTVMNTHLDEFVAQISG